MGVPLMSKRALGMMGAPSSLGRPMPSNTRPSMSGDTASSMEWPRKRALASEIFSPWELSNSCTRALSPLTSSTRPERISPLACSISTSS